MSKARKASTFTPPAFFDNRKIAFAIGFLVAGISVFAYRSISQVFFVQDDFWFLQAAQKPWPNEFLYGGVLPDYWRPISTYWYHWINVTLFGTSAVWHHVILLGIFGLTVFLWGLALFEITGSYLGEFAGAFVYGASRLHLYTLGWVSGAIDILAALFLVLTLFLIWRGRRTDVPLWTVLISLILGVLSKEPVAIVPVLAIFGLIINSKVHRVPFMSWEKRLIKLFVGVEIVYIMGWILHTTGHRSGTSVGIFIERGYYLLGNAIAALIPILDYQDVPPWYWFLLPLFLVTGILLLERKNGVFGIIWGVGLYCVPVLPFVLFDYPQLQPYYAHFSMLGLSLLFALVLAAVWRKMHLINLHWVFQATTALGLMVFLLMAILVVEKGIASYQSPALFEAQYSKAAYDQISRHCRPEDGCQTLIFYEVTDLMWWSIGKGVMVPVMFPGVEAHFDGYSGYNAPPNTISIENTIFLKQVSDKEFQVVH